VREAKRQPVRRLQRLRRPTLSLDVDARAPSRSLESGAAFAALFLSRRLIVSLLDPCAKSMRLAASMRTRKPGTIEPLRSPRRASSRLASRAIVALFELCNQRTFSHSNCLMILRVGRLFGSARSLESTSDRGQTIRQLP